MFSGSSFPGPDAASTPTGISHDFALAGSGGSSSEEASQTASWTPRRTIQRDARFYREVARLQPAFATTDDPDRRSRPWLRVYRIYP